MCSTPADDRPLRSRRPLCLPGHWCTLSLRAHKPSSDNLPGAGPPTHSTALPTAQAVGGHTDPSASGNWARPQAPTQAPAPALGAQPPSLTCDNMTTLHQPAPHFREPRRRSCYAIRLYSQRHKHTGKSLRRREQLPGPEGGGRVHTARAGLDSGRDVKSRSTRRTRSIGVGRCGRGRGGGRRSRHERGGRGCTSKKSKTLGNKFPNLVLKGNVLGYEWKMFFATSEVQTVSHYHQRGRPERGGALFCHLTL